MSMTAINAVNEATTRPSASAREAKTELTTRIAREIMDGEVAKREAKTERLRAARLAMEAEAVSEEPAAPKARKKRVAAK
jgi:hypothetical protein